MDFSFQPKITKELILSRFSEEQLMEYYLHIPVKKGLFRSPLRRDKQPTCSFYRNKSGTLIFKDFATGQHLNIFDVVQSIFRCDYFESLRIIANDFGIVRDNALHKNPGKINLNPIKIKDKEISKIQIEVQEFTDSELKWWGKYGISKDILKRFDVYSCKHVFLNDQLFAESQQHCPIFGYYGKKYQGLELWRCYFPKRTSFRFITNWPSKKIQGYDQLPKKGKLLVITKSMKDSMCLYSCGITACAPNSENLFIPDKVLEDLKNRFENIVVLYDNDRPGLYNMAKIRKEHPELTYVFIPKRYGSKDISDFYKDHGRKETLNLIKTFILWLKEHRQN
nr:MAG TPA: DNA primase [Bacteriophage sp.]